MNVNFARTKNKIVTTARLCAVLAASLPLFTGCNSKAKPTPENFTQAINAYYQDRSECLFSNMRFPYATSDAAVVKQMNTLVQSHLLEASYESAVKTTRYTVSTTGTRYAPRFCYGHRAVASIDHFTTPEKGPSGFPETNIEYHYTLLDVPVWARSAEIGAAYPQMAQMAANGGTDKISLAQTLAGWQVPER
ncbi:MAG TPA: hypothetical protein VGB69_11435 [Edaphobacter sp.]